MVRALSAVVTVLLLWIVLGNAIGFHALSSYSRYAGKPVWRAVLEGLAPSLELFAFGLIIALVLATVYSYVAKRSLVAARIGEIGVLVLDSIPFFWLSVIATYLLAMSGRRDDFGWSSIVRFDVLDHLKHVWLPAFVVAVPMLAAVTYERTRGELSPLRAIARHLSAILASQLFVEIVFAWPSLGRLFWNALTQSDFALPWAILLVVALVAVIARIGEPQPQIAQTSPGFGQRVAVVGIITVAVALLIVIASAFAPDPLRIDNEHWVGWPLPPCFVNVEKCGGHELGTDGVARDILGRLVAAAKPSLGLSFVAALFASLASIGAYSVARRNGALNAAVTVITHAISSFPMWPALVVLSATEIDHSQARLMPSLVIASTVMLSARRPTGVRAFAFQWASIMLVLATVDFFGMGIQPPTGSWGNMLADMQSNLTIAWWAAVFPAACLRICPCDPIGRNLCRRLTP